MAYNELMNEIDTGERLSKLELAKAALAKGTLELSPYFANFGLTESSIVAAGILIESGLPTVPILAALMTGRKIIVDELRRKYPQTIFFP